MSLESREVQVNSSVLRAGRAGPFPAEPGAFLSGLRTHRAQLTRSEQKIADFLLDETDEAIRLSITEFAGRVDVGEATITRFCQRLGLRGFQDLKVIAAQGMAPGAINSVEIPKNQMTGLEYEVTRRSMILIADTARLLPPGLLERVALLLAHAVRIDCYGIGLSGYTAREAQLGFMRIGKSCNAYGDGDAQFISASLLTERDVAIGFSHSGNAREVAHALTRARDRGAKTVAVTSQPGSPVALAADLVVPVAPGETPYASSVNSKIAHLFLVDLLIESVAQVLASDREVREQVS
jgi:DNA-binding MurR/RpiR family transcriptional regulator